METITNHWFLPKSPPRHPARHTAAERTGLPCIYWISIFLNFDGLFFVNDFPWTWKTAQFFVCFTLSHHLFYKCNFERWVLPTQSSFCLSNWCLFWFVHTQGSSGGAEWRVCTSCYSTRGGRCSATTRKVGIATRDCAEPASSAFPQQWIGWSLSQYSLKNLCAVFP